MPSVGERMVDTTLTTLKGRSAERKGKGELIVR